MKDLTKDEMIDLLNVEMDERIAKLEKIGHEIKIREDDVREILTKFEAGEIRTAEHAKSLVADVENHLARLMELREQIRLMNLDVLMDLEAISRHA